MLPLMPNNTCTITHLILASTLFLLLVLPLSKHLIGSIKAINGFYLHYGGMASSSQLPRGALRKILKYRSVEDYDSFRIIPFFLYMFIHLYIMD